MNKLTAEEIIALIEAAYISVDQFGFCNFKTPEGVGKWKEVEQRGGEGEGAHYTSVKYFEDHDVYIETVGFYQSYNGTDWDQGYGEEVFPVEVTKIEYQTKPKS